MNTKSHEIRFIKIGKWSKKIILISILIGSQLFAVANNNNKKNDSKKKHKLNYNEFMTQYGDNDTAAVIIEIFFDKRENAAKGQLSFLPISTAIAVVLPPVGVGLMAISTPLFINGLIVNQKYSRKKLMNILNDYQYNNELPLKLKNQVVEYLQEEEYYDRYIEDKAMDLRAVRISAAPSNEVVVQTNIR